MRYKAIGLFLIISISTFFYASAQSLQADSLLYSKAAKQVVEYFNTTIGEGAEIYNGPVYIPYPPANKGTFYFLDKNYCTLGLINYNGTWYKNVPVLYDVYHDIMVLALNDNLFVLSTEKLSDVFLSKHHFINITINNAADLIPGFYEELYEGKSLVLAKRKKIINDHVTSTQTAETFYEDNTALYVKKGSKYYHVDSRGSLLDVFKEKKKELRQYIKANNIDYDKDKEGATVKLATWYDLNNN